MSRRTGRELEACLWPAARLPEAIDALARASGLARAQRAQRDGVADGASGEAEPAPIAALATAAGLEAEPTRLTYAELPDLLARAGPALLRLDGEERRDLALLRGGRRRVLVLGADLRRRWLPLEALRAALGRAATARHAGEVEAVLAAAQVAPRRRARARAALLGQRLASEPLGVCWLLRSPPAASFAAQAAGAGLSRRLAGLTLAHAAQYLLWLASWWLVGSAALSGRMDRGWVLSWALLLATLIPFQLLVTWLQGAVALGAGALLKRRLLAGALRLEPEEVRHQGVGQLLGRVVEAEAMESLALSGGLLGLVAGIELALAVAVLALGAGGWPMALLLVAWTGVALALAGRYHRRRRAWTEERLAMTHDLVEGMIGHRTRLAQEDPAAWHRTEDAALARYLERSRAMDVSHAELQALVPRGWLLLGLLALAPAFVGGRGTAAGLAIAVGGLLVAFRALRRLSAGIAHLAGAGIAWRQVAPLFAAGARAADEPCVGPPPKTDGTAPAGAPALLEADDLVFRHAGRPEPVLDGCDLRIAAGDQLLLEGPSGGGKSTLAALLAGWRAPASGLLLLGGLDRHTLGESGWRKRVVAAPQFHENHVLTESFAFNALLGRDWPPSQRDLDEVDAVCRGLGLGELLDRMPAGLLQTVGDTGWQLSHGERSRLFLARALLQDPELLLLDESFAALDPENLERALTFVRGRARSLLVIAHP